MMKTIIPVACAAVIGSMTMTAAQAQDVRVIERGPARDVAPVGVTVDGPVDVDTDILGVDERPSFRRYVIDEHLPSYRFDGPVRAGVILPPEGISYYDVPPEFGVRDYRYTVINDAPVLVDPATRRIVDVVE